MVYSKKAIWAFILSLLPFVIYSLTAVFELVIPANSNSTLLTVLTGLFFLGLLSSLIALILGIWFLVARNKEVSGKGLSIAAIVLSILHYIFTVTFAIIFSSGWS